MQLKITSSLLFGLYFGTSTFLVAEADKLLLKGRHIKTHKECLATSINTTIALASAFFTSYYLTFLEDSYLLPINLLFPVMTGLVGYNFLPEGSFRSGWTQITVPFLGFVLSCSPFLWIYKKDYYSS
jgi:hypothetical protein